MDLAVEPAGTDRVPELAALLGRAFADDPMMTFCFGTERTEAATTRMFEIVNPAFAEEGWLWEVGPGAGVAMWVPPDGMDRYREIEDETDAATSALTPDGGERERALWDWIEANLPEGPQWYLDHLAVDETHRGEGFGAALVRHGLELGRRDGVPATLETARPRNVEIYSHLGFRTVVEGDVADGGPHLWVMRADPDAG